jgi:hypothetical protein
LVLWTKISLAVAAHKKMALATLNFPGAYLYATLKRPHYMRLAPEVAQIARGISDTSGFERNDGSLVVEFKFALYGLPESGAV